MTRFPTGEPLEEKELVSACCKAELKVIGGDEVTMFYQCLECGKACNPSVEEV